jgi:hypothetical protein
LPAELTGYYVEFSNMSSYSSGARAKRREAVRWGALTICSPPDPFNNPHGALPEYCRDANENRNYETNRIDFSAQAAMVSGETGREMVAGVRRYSGNADRLSLRGHCFRVDPIARLRQSFTVLV